MEIQGNVNNEPPGRFEGRCSNCYTIWIRKTVQNSGEICNQIKYCLGRCPFGRILSLTPTGRLTTSFVPSKLRIPATPLIRTVIEISTLMQYFWVTATGCRRKSVVVDLQVFVGDGIEAFILRRVSIVEQAQGRSTRGPTRPRARGSQVWGHFSLSCVSCSFCVEMNTWHLWQEMKGAICDRRMTDWSSHCAHKCHGYFCGQDTKIFSACPPPFWICHCHVSAGSGALPRRCGSSLSSPFVNTEHYSGICGAS